jgi:threonine/homoserine/homoserine lactone efflux protein
MNNLIKSLPDVFYAINVIGGCLLVFLFVLIITNSFGD